jgi:Fic family protein
MVKTDDFQLCHEYLKDYIETIKKQLNQCEIKIMEQSQRFSITKLSIDQVDHCLKEYVDCQRKYLTMRNTQQLVKFKDTTQKKDLSKAISSTDTITNNQVRNNTF